MQTWEHHHTLRGHKGAVISIALEKNFLFTGSDDTTIKVWETHNNYMLYSLEGHTSGVRSIIILDMGYLISCGADKKVKAWDYKEQKCVKTVEKSEELRCLTYLPLLKNILLGSSTGQIHLMKLQELIDVMPQVEEVHANSTTEKHEEVKQNEDDTFILDAQENEDNIKIQRLLEQAKLSLSLIHI